MKVVKTKLKRLGSNYPNTEWFNFSVWTPPCESCIFCKKTRQVWVKKNGKLVKVKNETVTIVDMGVNRCLYIFYKYHIILKRTHKVCTQCISVLDCLLEIKPWLKTPEQVCVYGDKRNMFHKKAIVVGYLTSNKIWTAGNMKKEKMNVVKQIIYDIRNDKNKIKLITSKYKGVTGLTKKQLKQVLKEIVTLVKKKAVKETGQSYFNDLRSEKVWVYTMTNVKGQNKLLQDLLRLFIKWKTNASNRTLAALTECSLNTFCESIRKITTVVRLYSNKWLVNTREKLKKHKVKCYYDLMGLDESIDIVIGDGVRFKSDAPKNYHLQHFTFDNKHKQNSYNTIGFCCITGYYIGFYPKKGLGSDGGHPDGFATDFLFLNDMDRIITDVVTPNTYCGSNDGTRVLFDRALRMGSFLYEMKLINWGHPNLKLGKQSTKQANDTRKKCTTYRWLIEKSFGNLGNKWKIFRANTTGLNGYYYPLFGEWLDFAGAICNHLRIGISTVDKERISQVKWMKNNEIHKKWFPWEKSRLQKILEQFRLNRSLSQIWYLAKTPEILYVNSVWNQKKVNDTFCLNESELKLYGGGIYARENADLYIVHSRQWIQVYFSKIHVYQNYLMIRGIKKRMTRVWENTQKKNAKREDYAIHNVILAKRRFPVINVWRNEKYTDKLKHLDSVCDCVIGSRDICKDSHIITALLFLKKWINHEPLPAYLKSEHKYRYLYDINHFKSKISSLKGIQKVFFANKWAGNVATKLANSVDIS